ncbi:YybS family protein [Desertibacillus haloalkaliphilus]|uniref:YybS family protein n=1 Tax=Desertibacillus haloalkaliphilus TaxID=1328930 RepID=UPI001C25F751|nr:YybS family protein [Desertibacillus haloalkaliphilus]MBU8905777.1 YybS family protein [Desertibacillus haloalkaliphilus]
MKNTRVLTEGAIIAALFAILLFLTLYLPIIGSIVIWLLPIPFIVYVYRHGLKAGLILWFVAFFVSFIIGGLLVLPLTLMFGSGGIVVGELYRRKKSAFAVLLGGSLTYIANLLLSFIASIVLFGIHPIEAIQEMMLQSIATAEGMLGAVGQESTEQLQPMYDMIDQLIHLAPVMLIVTGIGFALIIQLIASVVLRRLGGQVEPLPRFREWRFPRSFLWYYLAVSLFIIIGVEEGSTLYVVVWNLFPILEIAMTIQGLALIFYYFHVKKVSKAVPIIILILGFVIPFLLYLIRILGIIDLGFDLRKRMESQEK